MEAVTNHRKETLIMDLLWAELTHTDTQLVVSPFESTLFSFSRTTKNKPIKSGYIYRCDRGFELYTIYTVLFANNVDCN